MVPFVEKEMPAMPGASRGKESRIVDAKNVKLNGSTPLAEGAIIEFLSQCITCETDGDVAGKVFTSILMSVNGKQRWISTGTFTQIDWCGTKKPVSPQVHDIAKNYADAQSLYNALHDRKMVVKSILHTKKQVWKDGNLTDELTTATYPVLEFVD